MEGAGEPVEFRHDQGVAVAAGGQRLAEAGSFAVATGQPVVDVDPVGGDAQGGEAFALDGEVLFVGGASGVKPGLVGPSCCFRGSFSGDLLSL